MGYLGKIIVAAGFEKLPKVKLIDQSGHTATNDERNGKEKFNNLLHFPTATATAANYCAVEDFRATYFS